MEYMCEQKDLYAPIQMWGRFFTISYRNKDGEICGNYQGQFCPWCGKGLDPELPNERLKSNGLLPWTYE